MAEQKGLNLFDMFGHKFPSTDERLRQAYVNPVVQERFSDIMRASGNERSGLQAQLTAYLAAAHTLFPEESEIIHKSLNENDSSV